jgi:hypothetical protein
LLLIAIGLLLLALLTPFIVLLILDLLLTLILVLPLLVFGLLLRVLLLGSSPAALASVAWLAVAASPVSPAPALQVLLAVPVSEVWLVPASQQV